jgi:hypothetical protein
LAGAATRVGVWHDLHPTLCFSAGRFFLVRTKLAISDETNGREEITREADGLIKNMYCGLIQEIMMDFFYKMFGWKNQTIKSLRTLLLDKDIYIYIYTTDCRILFCTTIPVGRLR